MNVVKTQFQRFKQKAHIIIYGTNTLAGKMFDLLLLGLILLSVLLIMLESVREIDRLYHSHLLVLEWVITIFFTVEYLLRIITIKKPVHYIFSFYGIIDLVAILPMYLSFVITGASVFAIVRALRLLRLFKILNLPQFNSHASHLREALMASKGKILIFIYFIIVSVILIGSVMYVVEGEAGGFTSIPISIYWAIVTLTTVGYGDISPVTPLGQLIASVVMIMGYGVIAVPTGIVTAELAKNKEKKNRNTESICSHCGATDHLNNAKFCHKCGAGLE